MHALSLNLSRERGACPPVIGVKFSLSGLELMNIHKGIHFKYDDIIDQYQQNRRLQFE